MVLCIFQTETYPHPPAWVAQLEKNSKCRTVTRRLRSLSLCIYKNFGWNSYGWRIDRVNGVVSEILIVILDYWR